MRAQLARASIHVGADSAWAWDLVSASGSDSLSVAELKARLRLASRSEVEELEVFFREDTRKGVISAFKAAYRRLDAQEAEAARLGSLYAYERELCQGKLAVGLDEVGRGPLAGPLTVGAVVLRPDAEHIAGLNDSKQVPAAHRAAIAEAVKKSALAWALVDIPPAEIDERGISWCLRKAFSTAVRNIEEQGVVPGVVLLDGNPLHFDKREINVVHGDAKCASIAAASIIAKVSRDAYMVALDEAYPGYDFASSKGYGSARHRAAIASLGLTPVHRRSFCNSCFQESLF